MHKQIFPTGTVRAAPRSETATVVILLVILILIFFILFVAAPPAQGQTYNVIYRFTNGADGQIPMTGLTMDRAGNLYGTTSSVDTGWP